MMNRDSELVTIQKIGLPWSVLGTAGMMDTGERNSVTTSTCTNSIDHLLELSMSVSTAKENSAAQATAGLIIDRVSRSILQFTTGCTIRLQSCGNSCMAQTAREETSKWK